MFYKPRRNSLLNHDLQTIHCQWEENPIINPITIPPIVMATLMLYVGFYHLLIYLRLKKRRESLSFALFCICAGLYSIACAGLYNAPSPEVGVEWQRIQEVTLTILAALSLWFIAYYTNHTNRTIVIGFTFYFIVAALVILLIRGDLMWSGISVKIIDLPFGYSIKYNEMAPGTLINAHSLLVLIYCIYIFWVGLKLYKNGNKEKGLTLLTGLIILFAGTLNDRLVKNGLYETIYMLEYSYIVIIMLFTLFQTNNVIKAVDIKLELWESEKKYRTLFDSSIDAMTIIDLNTGKFIDCNDSALKLHDIENRDSFIGLTPDQLSPEYQPGGGLSRNLASENLNEAFQKGSKTFEWYHSKNNGTTFPVIVTLSAMVLGEKKFVLSIGKDITERKIAEEEREILIYELREAVENVKTLSGLIPICSRCKKIRDGEGYWKNLEMYIEEHSSVLFSHSICSQCTDELYKHEDWYKEMKKKEK